MYGEGFELSCDLIVLGESERLMNHFYEGFIHKKKTRKQQEMLENYQGDPSLIKDDPRFNIENISIDSQEEIGTTTSDREALEREKALKRFEEEKTVGKPLGKQQL